MSFSSYLSRRLTAIRRSLLLALLLGGPATALATKVIHTEPSAFSPILVYELRNERCMTFGSVHAVGRQTCIDLQDARRMVFQYTRMVMSSLWLQPQPRRILVIGLGGGTLPGAFADLLPEAIVDSVEIDPAVVKVASTYFGYKPGPRQRVHVIDGRQFVEEAAKRNEQYDLIVLDAFDIDYIPAHLTTRQFLTTLRQLLSPDGVLAANTFSSSRLYDSESATYAEVFGEFYQLRGGNRVILASRSPLPNLETLRATAEQYREILQPYGVETDQLLKMLRPMPPIPANAPILDDANSTTPAS